MVTRRDLTVSTIVHIFNQRLSKGTSMEAIAYTPFMSETKMHRFDFTSSMGERLQQPLIWFNTCTGSTRI